VPFSADRLDAAMLIAGQLAVSLDNALAERFRSLVQRSSDVTLVCDRAGVLSYASAASAGMLGIEDTALAGRAMVELVHADDRAAFAERARSVRTGDTETLECRAVSADGSGRWVEATFTDLSADPAVGGIMVHLRDVTERRRLEGKLRQAQKLESVGQLSAGIAHEMNSPIQFVAENIRFIGQAFADLAAVVGAYQETAPLVAERLAVELDTPYLLEEVPRAIAQTLEGVDRMATIVRAMKAFGDPRGDTRSQFDLNDAVRNTLVVADSEIRYVADVELELGELPPVWGNVGDVNQVVLNLVVNAAHAVGEAVTLGRARGTITLRTECDGDDVVLHVQDTGIGIPPEIADRVFEQVFTTQSVGRGTGQGLAVAYSLIHERHAGSITFTSEPGVGTTFTVRLPRCGSNQLSSQTDELAA
jgi:PAS domain S-box-containing protein